MSRLSRALSLTLTEYFKTTSLNGFGLLHFLRRRRYQRIFWLLFIVLGIGLASFVVFVEFWHFLAQPTVTALSALNVEMDSVPLPPLVICSTNKLSRRRVEEYAEELSQHGTAGTRRYWLQQLPLLAGYFTPAAVQAQAAATLQAALGDRWPQDVRAQLLHLAPSCEELLLTCHVEGRERNCTQLFRLTPTIEGCCCELQAAQGVSGELRLRLNATRADDFRMPRTTHGAGSFRLHLHGWLGRHSVSQGDSVALEVHALKLQADLQLRSYPIAERGCHFADESEELVMCLPLCRLRSTLAACNCAPYFFDLAAIPSNFSYCNLSHAACLQQLEGELGNRNRVWEQQGNHYVVVDEGNRLPVCFMVTCHVDSCNWLQYTLPLGYKGFYKFVCIETSCKRH